MIEKQAQESIEYLAFEFDDCKKIMELDRTEVIENIFTFTGGRLVLEKSHWDLPDWPIAEKNLMTEKAQADFSKSNAKYIGAFHNARLVGYVRVANREGFWELEHIVVSNGFRRLGIATRLADLAKNEVAEAGGETIYMICTPAEPAVRFYLSVGFEPFDVPEDEYWRSSWDGEDLYMEMKL